MNINQYSIFSCSIMIAFAGLIASCNNDKDGDEVVVRISAPEWSISMRDSHASLKVEITVDGDDSTKVERSVQRSSANNLITIPIVVPGEDESEIVVSWYLNENILLASRAILYNLNDWGTIVSIPAESYEFDTLVQNCSTSKYHSDTDCVPNIKEFYRGTDPRVDDALPTMVSIPPLEVQSNSTKYCSTIGSPLGEGDDPEVYTVKPGVRNETKEDPTEICFCRPYDMSATEISFAQYAAFTDENPEVPPSLPMSDETYAHPVSRISPNNIQKYVEWIGTRRSTASPDLVFRLPTEAEWEFAARAGGEKAFHTGDNITKQQANFKSGSSVPVTSYEPNDWGLYNVHGNIMELTCSPHTDYSYKDPANRAYQCVTSGRRAARGGAYIYDKAILRTAYRNFGSPGFDSTSTVPTEDQIANFDTGNHPIYGFRLAMGLENPQLAICPP